MRSRAEVAGLTPLLLGASTLGDRGEPAEVDALAEAMATSGLGGVDTSRFYAEGRSESALGRARSRTGARGFVATKTARRPARPPFGADDVRRSIEESLDALGTDRLELYHLHDPWETPFQAAMAPGGAVDALVALREEGVVGAIGVAVGRRDLVLDYVRTDVFDAVLTHNRYTLVDRTAVPVLEAARERSMTTINAAPFGGGILADPSRSTYGYRPLPDDFAAHVNRVRALAADFGVELAAAALRFSLRSDLVDSTVVGVSSLQRLAQLERLVTDPVPDEFFDALEALGPAPASAND